MARILRRIAMTLALLLAAVALVASACGDDDGDEDADAVDSDLGAAVAETSNLSIHTPFVPVPPAVRSNVVR